MSNDIFCYLTHLPQGVHEMVAPCPDGNFTVYIEISLTKEQQIKAYEHAVRHIRNDDCYRECSVNQVEFDNHLKGGANGN